MSRSSGGTCESTHSDNTLEGLYCPDLEYGGFFQTTFYHNARKVPYSNQSNHQLTTEFKSSIFNEVVLDDWYHIAFTRNGYTGAMYINGQLISVSTIMKNDALIRSPSSIRVGAVASSNWNNDNAFNGKIDQPAVWKRELSGEEISQLYNDGSGIKYDLWSSELKTDTENVIEFQKHQTVFYMHQLVNDNAEVTAFRGEKDVISNPSNPIFEGGKVSPAAFSSVYEDNNSDAIDKTVQRASIVIPTGLQAGFSVKWTLSAWVSPHGHGATSSGAATDFQYKGVDYKRAFGTIFSEYYAYQLWTDKSPNANFTVTFNGLI